MSISFLKNKYDKINGIKIYDDLIILSVKKIPKKSLTPDDFT